MLFEMHFCTLFCEHCTVHTREHAAYATCTCIVVSDGTLRVYVRRWTIIFSREWINQSKRHSVPHSFWVRNKNRCHPRDGYLHQPGGVRHPRTDIIALAWLTDLFSIYRTVPTYTHRYHTSSSCMYARKASTTPTPTWKSIRWPYNHLATKAAP